MRTVLAGIDEAGYGPILGPMVVGCFAVEVDGDVDTDLWQVLRRRVSRRKPTAASGKIHVADSKKVHSSSAGPAAIERSALALLHAVHGKPATLDALLSEACPERECAEPWHDAADDETFPLAAGELVWTAANALLTEMRRLAVGPCLASAHVLHEDAYNRMTTATRNKAAVLSSISLRHLHRLLTDHGTRQDVRLCVTCDRHGGRSSYGQLLRDMFPDWNLTVVAEDTTGSFYELGRDGPAVRVTFCEKADDKRFEVAAASLIAKYLREALMHRLNAWWAGHVPGLRLTAGYWTDGLRFLADTADARAALGITEDRLRRVR